MKRSYFWAALWLIGFHSAPGVRAAETIFCTPETCERLFEESIPTNIVGRSGGPSENLVAWRRRQCVLTLGAFLQSREFLPDQSLSTAETLCRDVQVGPARRTYNNFSVFDLNYSNTRLVRDREGHALLPRTVYSGWLPAYAPCNATYRFTSDERTLRVSARKIPTHQFYLRYPGDRSLFICGYKMSGLAEQSYLGPDPRASEHPAARFPYEGAPFQVGHDQAYQSFHRASTFVDTALVYQSSQLVRRLRQLANDARLRDQFCASLGQTCIAPRVIRLAGHPHYSEAIAYCEHDVIDRLAILPRKCIPVILKQKKDDRLVIHAIITPQTFFPSGNGVGDTDIVCQNTTELSVISILRSKFIQADGWRVLDRSPFTVSRIGYISDVYSNFREHFVMRINIGASREQILMTPYIAFSPQNVAGQSEFRPISVVEYGYYVTRLIERLRPEMNCVDTR